MTTERRIHRRRGIDEHRIVAARIRAGHRARVIDVSDGGALIEISHGLRPGAIVTFQFGTAQHETSVRGRVTRCAVAAIQSTSVSYRAAISFEYPIPPCEGAAACGDGVSASHDLV